MLVFVGLKHFPGLRSIVHGLVALSLLEFLLQVFIPTFSLFSTDAGFKLLDLLIKLLLAALGLHFGERSLLVYNTFSGAALFVTSVSYLTQWIPNIFQLINERRRAAGPLNPRQIPAELPSGGLTSRSASWRTRCWWPWPGCWRSSSTFSAGAANSRSWTAPWTFRCFPGKTCPRPPMRNKLINLANYFA